MKPLLRAGEHIEGMHWIAEYHPLTHEIRVLREDIEIGIYSAPPTMFGEEKTWAPRTSPIIAAGSRAARISAQLRAEHDTEE